MSVASLNYPSIVDGRRRHHKQQRTAGMMYRSSRFKRSLAKMSVLMMLVVFTYVLMDDKLQIQHHRSVIPVEISVSREWLDYFRLQRSLLLADKSLPLTPPSMLNSVKSSNDVYVPIANISVFERRSEELEENEKKENNEFASSWDDDIKSAVAKFTGIMPNKKFVFHNKLPKSGSSTMNNILKVLRRKNKFNFMKVDSGVTPFHETGSLVDLVKKKMKTPYLLLKHHYWMNFTTFNMEQPTFINVIRDPLEWFTSHFYFHRYGWIRKPGCRVEHCGMSEEDFNMTIDDCVTKRHKQCTMPWMYIPFFCGTTKDCLEIVTMEQKKRSLETAKKHLLNDYFLVGILEQFEDSLQMFETTMPSYFKGAINAWRGDFVQEKQELTRTLNKKTMSAESRRFFEQGPLKYEIELYRFARKLFNAKMRKLGIQPAPASASP